jgi:hypothetical protein
MNKVKNHRFGLIGLCVTAALALMAFAASAAQAEGTWMINGVNVTADLVVELELLPEEYTFENGETTETAKVALLLGETALGPIWIGCKKAVSSAVTLHASGGANGGVNFSECSTSIKQAGHMKLSAICKPKEPIDAAFKALIVLHEKVPYLDLEGAGGTFTTIEIPEGCALEGKYPVKGLVLVEDCKGEWAKELLEHLIKEAMGPTLALSKGLTFGGFTVSIDGSAFLHVYEKGVMKTYSILAK